MKSRSGGAGSDQMELTRRQLLKASTALGIGLGLGGAGLLGAGCGGSTPASSASPSAAGVVKRGGIMQMATDQLFPKDSLETSKLLNDGQFEFSYMIKENLVSFTEDYTIVPKLAESWEASADVKQFTFHLRPNVKFHDGKPFGADDVAWNLEQILDPKQGNPVQARLAESLSPSGIKIVDDLTIKLELKRPDSMLLFVLARANCIISRANETEWEKMIGTGPFMYKSFVAGESFETVKNPDYWDPELPYLDGVRAIQIAEASTILQSVAAGPSHVAPITSVSLPAVKANSALQLQAFKGAHLITAVMDMTAKPFTDGRVIEAMKRALDRDKLMSIAYADQSVMAPDTQIRVTDPFFTDSLVPRIDMDRDAATKLMTEAGYPDGIDLDFKVLNSPLYTPFGLGLAAALEGSPFRINVIQAPADTYWDVVWMKDPFYMSEWSISDPINLMLVMEYSSSPQNEARWKDPKMDELLTAALAVQGEEQVQAITAAGTYMSENCGMLIPAYADRLYISKKGTQMAWLHNGLIDFNKSANS